MSEDWLDAKERVPQLSSVVEIPSTFAERVALVERCWEQLSTLQRTFLMALRENRFRVCRTAKKLGYKSHRSHTSWMQQPEYASVFRAWQALAGGDALDKDRLLVRQDHIVETLLTPKPILHQGAPTGFKEVDAGAASRANEVLMKAAGLLKDKELEVNVGIIGPSLQIAVVQPNGEAQQVQLKSVPVPDVLDAEAIPVEEDWLNDA